MRRALCRPAAPLALALRVTRRLRAVAACCLLALLASTALAAPPAWRALTREEQDVQRELVAAAGAGLLRKADAVAAAWLAKVQAAKRPEALAAPPLPSAPGLPAPALPTLDEALLWALQQAARQAEQVGDVGRGLTLRLQTVALLERTGGVAGGSLTTERLQLAIALLRAGRRDESSATLQQVEDEVRANATSTPLTREPTLLVLAMLHNNLQRFGPTMRLYEEARAAYRAAPPAYGSQLVQVGVSLATLHWLRGDLASAQTELAATIAEAEKQTAFSPVALAWWRQMLAQIARLRGDSATAEAAMAKAHAAFESQEPAQRKHLGTPQALLAVSAMVSLAGHHQQAHRWGEADAVYARALQAATDNKVASEAWLDVFALQRARLWVDGGRSQRDAERLRKALALLEPITARQRKVAGGLAALNGLLIVAEAAHQLGDFAKAEAVAREIDATYRQLWGDRHPINAVTLGRLADAQLAGGRHKAAWQTLQRLTAPIDGHLAWVLAVGTEQEQRQAIDALRPQRDRVLSALPPLAAAKVASEPVLSAFGYGMVLRHKGRLLDVLAQALRRLKNKATPAQRALIERLQVVRAELAALALLRPPEAERPAQLAQIARLEAEARRLELQLAASHPAMAAVAGDDSVAALQARIPDGAALVEYAFHLDHDPSVLPGVVPDDTPPAQGRYQAFVLRRKGPVVRVDLGEAAAIDAAVTAFRKALQRPKIPGVQGRARALDAKIWQPLAAALAGAGHVQVAPDAALDLVPFGALQGEDGHYRIETTTFTYLSSGRDLLRMGARSAPRGGPVLLGDPDFAGPGPSPAPGAATSTGAPPGGTVAPDDGVGDDGPQRSGDLASMRWEPLPGTADEARAIAATLPGAKLLLGADATEAALRAVAAPSLLHVATHGFFLARQAAIAAESQQLPENPLIRSGLMLAGATAGAARRAAPGGGDGVLTALEAGDLDLDGTRLVVLSACETAVGELREGDGVQGLRRTLAIAGAETLITSLWKVDDTATRDLMVQTYGALHSGQGRSAGLRAAQLAMLATPARKHPYYWAAFLVAGRWDALR